MFVNPPVTVSDPIPSIRTLGETWVYQEISRCSIFKIVHSKPNHQLVVRFRVNNFEYATSGNLLVNPSFSEGANGWDWIGDCHRRIYEHERQLFQDPDYF